MSDGAALRTPFTRPQIGTHSQQVEHVHSPVAVDVGFWDKNVIARPAQAGADYEKVRDVDAVVAGCVSVDSRPYQGQRVGFAGLDGYNLREAHAGNRYRLMVIGCGAVAELAVSVGTPGKKYPRGRQGQ